MITKSTTDIYLAAIYLALGAKLAFVDKDDIRHQEFHFNGVEEFDKIKTEYINGDLMINAVKFKESIQRLKSEIYSK